MIRSDECRWTDLLADRYVVADRDRLVLDQRSGWARRWLVTWRVAGGQVVCPVRDMGGFPLAGCEPVRAFSWRTTQRHRPGLAFLVSTGRHHGFESIAEQRLLLVMDFAADVVDALSQPLRLRFFTADGPAEHVPDFLVVAREAVWLIDVRPAGRVGDDDRVRFAASAEAALACGWRYVVVCGWRPQVWASVEALSAQRRELTDPLGIAEELLAAVADGPAPLAQVVAATRYPALGRAHLLHLLWRRRLGTDLARPLGDRALVWAGRAGGCSL
ncbi:TnsA-like heteromeric transposase endonuclease subunit [Actinomadura opuntiae]|uniref:TnsA-like heteromeric transposase endonuclease subunit n=1 Tax=Actinomadura sp. OS1-43 TaxID=604315 RepID=UPI00255AA470|nr:TnsA-like heteromeric transposase endonuclease subunit [Actinomadura sp. OS1-43]MDL4813180.1 TnsA-like heteromeric transposase endonuclease subunit [Actinomadura sp. OS1-43]